MSGWWRGAWALVLAAVVWAVLAIRTPTNTFHFAPLVVAVVWPLVLRADRGMPGRRRSAVVVLTGPALAVLVGVVLSATGNLEGPTFWSDGGAPVEVVLFALAGGVAGWVVLRGAANRS